MKVVINICGGGYWGRSSSLFPPSKCKFESAPYQCLKDSRCFALRLRLLFCYKIQHLVGFYKELPNLLLDILMDLSTEKVAIFDNCFLQKVCHP